MKEYFTYINDDKIHVCTKNIRVGDKVTHNNQINKVLFGKELVVIEITPSGCYKTIHGIFTETEILKIIGTIQNPAPWIKEMDLDKDQIIANGVGPNWNDIPTNMWKFKIKCPTCKNYN